MLALVLGLALTQAPKVVVVQTSSLGVPAKRAAELTALLLDLLKAEKLDAIEAKTACDSRSCVIATAKRAEAAGALSLSFASLGKDTVMDLESISVSDGKAIAQTTFTAKASDTKLPFEALAFAADTRRALPVPAPAPAKVAQTDAPRDTTVTPANPPPGTEPPPAGVTAEASSSSTWGVRIGLMVAAVLVGAAALVMWSSGEIAKKNAAETEPGSPMRSVYTKAQADNLISAANLRLNIAGGLGIAAGALAGVALVTFAF